jgi:hypothetical protein
MGLFGDQDAAEISDNPFHVDEGIYPCVLSQFELREQKDGSSHSLLMQWTIEDDSTDFDGMNLSEWIRVYITPEERENADPKFLRMDQSRAKARLAAIGMSNAEMDALIDEDCIFNEDIAEKYVGVVREVEVVERPDKADPEKKYTNIKDVSDPAAA